MTIVEKIKSLKEHESIKVIYKNQEYFIECHLVFSTGNKSMCMFRKLDYKYDSMNIDKITNKYISLYTYDMFGNKNSAKIKIEDISIVEEVDGINRLGWVGLQMYVKNKY